MNKKISVFSMMKRLYVMAIKAYPLRMLVYSVVLFLNGISSVFVTYATEKFYNTVEISVESNLGMNNAIVVTFGLLIVIILLGHALNGMDNYLGDSLHIWLRKTFLVKLHEKAGRIEPIRYEDSTFLDKVNKAINASGAEGCTFALEAFMVVIFANVPYVLLMCAYLYKLQPILVLCIFLVFIPVLVSQYIRIEVFAKLEDIAAHARREALYYQECIGGLEYYKETRLLGAFNYFITRYRKTIEEVNKKTWQSNSKVVKIEICVRMLSLVGYLGVLVLLIFYVMRGDITIGAFAAVFLAISTIFETFECAIIHQLGGVNSRLGIVRNYIEFLDENERAESEKMENNDSGVVLENVSFSYVNGNKIVLKNINLKVHRGEMIAIVGENGAGKSTLIKVMIGLYKPLGGKVTIDGNETDTCAMVGYQRGISGIFQNFQKYKMSLKENIIISDLENNVHDKLDGILDESGIDFGDDINLETVLSKEFGGVELSGGQWQRIAIARGLYRKSNIIVLDEPTAAIDPMEETRIYRKFSELAQGKTAILVTHRMGSCKMANRIIVMDDGEIVEIGNHEELLQKKGKYFEMYTAQAQWY